MKFHKKVDIRLKYHLFTNDLWNINNSRGFIGCATFKNYNVCETLILLFDSKYTYTYST
jgi:hypothetical protein